MEHVTGKKRLPISISLPESEVYAVAWTRLFWRSLVAGVAIAALSLLAVVVNRQAKREAVLTGELEHRVKNTLAVVASVIERAREDAQSIEIPVITTRPHSVDSAYTKPLGPDPLAEYQPGRLGSH